MRVSIQNLVFDENVYVRLIGVNTLEDELISKEAYHQVKKLAAEKYGVADWTIEKSAFGKPFFVNNAMHYLSISHTDNMIAIAVCKGFSIGIDIEKIHKMSEKLVEKYYAENEKKAILLNEHGKEKEEIKIWTLKEAHCKCTGEGLSRNTLRWDSISDSSFFHESRCVDDYVITVCKERMDL